SSQLRPASEPSAGTWAVTCPLPSRAKPRGIGRGLRCTDDFDEQDFKSPEEIRKANLCFADLRGAILEGVDFYLVGLRGALLDEQQEAHARRCGAILEDRG